MTQISGSNIVKLTWTDTSDADYYWIYYGTSDDVTEASVYTRSAESGTDGYEIKLRNHGDYYFWLRGSISNSSYASGSDVSEYSDPVVLEGFKFVAPTEVTVKASDTTNKVSVTWTDNGAYNYWIYYNTTNDTATASEIRYGSSYYATNGYDIKLYKDGTYYFWVKAAGGYSSTDDASDDFSDVVSYEFTYTELLDPPTGIKVKASETTNNVSLTWTDNGADTYWIYYNTTNDTNTATRLSEPADFREYYLGYDIPLYSSGTYYFWIRATDGYHTLPSEDTKFSEVAVYEFTYTELTGLTVKASDTANKVSVTWTDNGAKYYWIYYNTTNNTETATCKTRYASSYDASYGYDITLSESGTYYFWVKAADGSSTSSKSSDFSEAVTYEFTCVE